MAGISALMTASASNSSKALSISRGGGAVSFTQLRAHETTEENSDAVFFFKKKKNTTSPSH
ncbi:hypothetical protein, partial [Pseudomonas syringae]|uniref:hypothetical protein n=1 Tax=Pseudomonas syringae TaxID=317 RepID=UPI001F1E839D